MSQGYNPMAMTPASVMGMPAQSVPLTDNLQQRQAEMQRQYQMRLQQMQQGAQQFGGQQRQQNGGPNPMASAQGVQGVQGGQGVHSMVGGNRPGFPQQNQAGNDQVIRSIQTFMQAQGQPFNPYPTVQGRPISLASLFGTVIKHGGSQRITMANQWPMLVQSLGFLPQQFPTAVQEIQTYWARNLAAYERFYISQKKKQAQAQQMGMMPNGVSQMSPTKIMQPGQQDQTQQYIQNQMQQQRNQPGPLTPRGVPADMNISNGSVPPQQGMQPTRQPNVMQHQRIGSAAPSETGPTPEQHPAVPQTPTKGNKMKSGPLTPPGETQVTTRLKFKPNSSTYQPRSRILDWGMYGAYDLDYLIDHGTKLAHEMPNIPRLEEMGIIDIRALIMSLQCGIHSDVRLALDHLVLLSYDPRLPSGGLELANCEDLVDALVDCAEEQLEFLAEDAVEVSDTAHLYSYEDLVRGCLTENATLQDVPEFGTEAFELDRASDRLIAVSTILRNLSFTHNNHKFLCYNPLIKLISNAIRLLGTRHMILRTYINTQDFMKDIVTFFSNTAQEISLPSQADANHILRFLLAFAPCPPPIINTSSAGVASVRFAPYYPIGHRYLPHAVDTLAKLLARDDPNRAHFKALFAAEAANPTPSLAWTNSESDTPHTHPYDLLTRTFALAIAPIPERARGHLSAQAELRIADARKPYLTQGMLAADILACLIPPTSATTQPDMMNGGPVSGASVAASPSNLARAWLESEDGWAPSLLRLVCVLSTDQSVVQTNAAAGRPITDTQQQGRARPGQQPAPRIDHEALGFGLVTHRALGMLRRLAEMAGVDDEVGTGLGIGWDELEEDVEQEAKTAGWDSAGANGIAMNNVEDVEVRDTSEKPVEGQDIATSVEGADDTPAKPHSPEVAIPNGDAEPSDSQPAQINGDADPLSTLSSGTDPPPPRKSRPSRTAAIAAAVGIGASKADVLPKREMLLGALLTPDIDAVALRGLCSLANLER